jgi:hypothetical protein
LHPILCPISHPISFKSDGATILSLGAFPPSHFCNKLADKLAQKVASQTNVTHFCLVCQSEVCCKPNWFATNLIRQLCPRVCHQVCCKNVIVETHLKQRLVNADFFAWVKPEKVI